MKDGKVAFQSFIRDISARKAIEIEKARQGAIRLLLQQITAAANKAASIDEAAHISLEQICNNAGYQLGHLYLTGRDESDLIYTDVWFDTDPVRFSAFRQFSENIALTCRQGIPGRVLRDRTPIWFEEVPTDPDLVRHMVASAAGIRSVFAFPILAENHILGVMECFSIHQKKRDEKLLEIANQIGAQLGYVIVRKRMEASVREQGMSQSAPIKPKANSLPP